MKQSTLLGVLSGSNTLSGNSEHSRRTCASPIETLDKVAQEKDKRKDVVNNLPNSNTKVENEIRKSDKISGDETFQSSAEVKVANMNEAGHDKTQKVVTKSTGDLSKSPKQTKSADDSKRIHAHDIATDLSSITMHDKQAVGPIAYEAFIAQLSHQSEMQDEQNRPATTSANVCQSVNNEKKIMPYSDFIKMFKAPLPKGPEESKPDDVTEEVEEVIVPEVKNQKEVKYRSVDSYFLKTESKSTKVRTSNSITVTIAADVHSECLKVEDTKQVKHQGILNLPIKMVTSQISSADVKDDIEFLSSETIPEQDADLRKKTISAKKRKNETTDQAADMSKKLKAEPNSDEYRNDVELSQEFQTGQAFESLKKQPNDSQFKTSKSMKIDNTSAKDGVIRSGKDSENKAPTEPCEELVPTSPVTIAATPAVKTSQSTLSLGKTGFALLKMETKKDFAADDESNSDNKNLDRRSSKRISIRKPLKDSEKKSKKIIHVDEQGNEAQCELTLFKRDSIPHSSQEAVSTGQQVPEIETSEASDDNAGTISLRRSARLARSYHEVKDADVVEIESDDDEDNGADGSKKPGKKVGAVKSSLSKGSPAMSVLKKPAGKLAPIFTLVKTKDEAKKKPLIVINPEQERLRREFLMSGIPEELKRQIASNASAVIHLEHPPLPTVSHVQQLPEETLVAQIKLPHLRVPADDCEKSIEDKDLTWRNLKWEQPETEKNSCLHTELFKKFSTHSPLSPSQLDHIFIELQRRDEKFPFRQTYTHLQHKFIMPEISECETVGNKATVSPVDVAIIDSDGDDVVVVDEHSPLSKCHNAKSSDVKSSLWSDFHQPESSEHIIGNKKAVKQLKKWLEEWKVIAEKQARKANRRDIKKKSKAKSKGSWSDESDFTDSEDEEMVLCNSVLITGPHGIGKTSSVYALARELGYKVFEVNSSSLRSGKQLLAQLEEATQSHRVAQNKTKSLFLDTPAGNVNLQTGKEAKSTSMPKSASHALAKLFNSAPEKKPVNRAHRHVKTQEEQSKSPMVDSNSGKSDSRTEKKKSAVSGPEKSKLTMCEVAEDKYVSRKRYQSKEDISPTKIKKKKKIDSSSELVSTPQQTLKLESSGAGGITSGSLNLASASLILFDEVDIVFEEDRGFLATVQHFMTTTKVPIILTSTDAFHHQLQVRHDRITLRKPASITPASFLSSICLAHGVYVDHQSLVNIYHHLNGDIRRCLLYLQYWCESGGGCMQIQKLMRSGKYPVSQKHTNSQSTAEMVSNSKQLVEMTCSVDGSSSDDSIDFVCLRPFKRKECQGLCDDKSAESSVVPRLKSHEINKSAASCGRRSSENKNVCVNHLNGESGREFTALHLRFEESFLGLTDCDSPAKTILEFIKAPSLSCCALKNAVQTCSAISQALNIDPIYDVVLHSLSLPHSDRLVTILTLPACLETTSQTTHQTTSWKRIVKGSDSSDEDSHDMPYKSQQSTENDKCPQNDKVNCMPDDHLKIMVEKQFVANRNQDGVETSNTSQDEVQVATSSEDQLKPVSNKLVNSHNKLMASVLSEFTRFYDNLSFIDSLDIHPANGSKLIPGLRDDEISDDRVSPHNCKDWSYNVCETVCLLAARKLHSTIEEHAQILQCDHVGLKVGDSAANNDDIHKCTQSNLNTDTYWQKEFLLPIGKSLPDLWRLAEKDQCQRLSSDPNVSDSKAYMDPSVYCSEKHLHLDYIPYLREICRVENARRISKSQRRFHHYLDNIGMSLKEVTMTSLASLYTVESSSQET